METLLLHIDVIHIFKLYKKLSSRLNAISLEIQKTQIHLQASDSILLLRNESIPVAEIR